MAKDGYYVGLCGKTIQQRQMVVVERKRTTRTDGNVLVLSRSMLKETSQQRQMAKG